MEIRDKYLQQNFCVKFYLKMIIFVGHDEINWNVCELDLTNMADADAMQVNRDVFSDILDKLNGNKYKESVEKHLKNIFDTGKRETGDEAAERWEIYKISLDFATFFWRAVVSVVQWFRVFSEYSKKNTDI